MEDDRWPERERELNPPPSAAVGAGERKRPREGRRRARDRFSVRAQPMEQAVDSAGSADSSGADTGGESAADSGSPPCGDYPAATAPYPGEDRDKSLTGGLGRWGESAGEDSAADSRCSDGAETGSNSSPASSDGETAEESAAGSTGAGDETGEDSPPGGALAACVLARRGVGNRSAAVRPHPPMEQSAAAPCGWDLGQPASAAPSDFGPPGANGLGAGAAAVEPAGAARGPTSQSQAPYNGDGERCSPRRPAALEPDQTPIPPYHRGAEMETGVPGVGRGQPSPRGGYGTASDLPLYGGPAEQTGPGQTLGETNGAEYTAAAEQGDLGPAGGEYQLPEAEDAAPPYPADFEKYWKIVEDNPYDFTGWTYVLQYVEQENHVWAVRRAFDSFFTRYPYCYGYWKKYADIEKRLGFAKEAEEVYQRGLQSIPLSVDLWVHYIVFLQEILEPTGPDTSVKLRSVFEMALAAAGTDFRSDRLWDMYVSWEKEQGRLKAVTAIYDRLLCIPTQLYSHHFEKFKEHVQGYSPKDVLSTDEFLRLRSEVVTSLAAAEADIDEGPPGDDPPPGVGTRDQEKADKELEKIRAHLEATRQETYLVNEVEVSKRWHFEESIKRPYFHVKPLERVQLKNWKDYLDFEMTNGTNERVLVLFERCVIACALYEDFWIKYAKYLEHHSVEAVRNVFQRACMVHLPKKPTLHLLWAAFEEQQGDIKEARRILKTFQLVVPGMAMVLLRRVSLERRSGELVQAETLLREAVELHQGTPLSSFFAIKLSRQLLKVQKNLAKARKVLLEAIDGDKENVKLYLNLLELEFSCDVRLNESNILHCFEQVLLSSLPLEIKIIFSQRRVEFLEDFGCSVRSLLHAYDEHQKLLKQNSNKKRAAENG
ncbi:pre-mRNA-processing factor 39-like [Amblyraja radiata]|uniref:pre-mRNA-processing factor 39-like n=1 Tax=Amblyraja radiata TaxID=386614 RepID=UPI0014032224|nr:pre-mRNA-processing factor 39-like [Amblyraja radiata]